jgi:hypothetical protein
MLLPFLVMEPYSQRTPSLINSDSSSSSSSDPASSHPIHSERDRPLPSLPSPGSSQKSYHIPFPTPRERSNYPIDKRRSVRTTSLARERLPRPASSVAKSLAWQRMQRTAVHTLKRPRILASLLHFLPWCDFYVLLSTCTGMRHLWDIHELRDVIMSHYVPEFRFALRHRVLSNCRDIDISLQDLDLLRWCSLLFGFQIRSDVIMYFYFY